MTQAKPKPITIEDYNPAWPHWFTDLKNILWPAVQDYALAIEHVGSTSIKNLAAKPIIDIDIIVADQNSSNNCIKALASLGYQHRGDLGIVGREAFVNPGTTKSPQPRPQAQTKIQIQAQSHPHHLYVCLNGCDSLANHLTLRNQLRLHSQDAATYAQLKKSLAAQNPSDMEAYIEGKTEFILAILAQYDFSSSGLSSIQDANQKNKLKENIQ